jgi:hypothetical protein
MNEESKNQFVEFKLQNYEILEPKLKVLEKVFNDQYKNN